LIVALAYILTIIYLASIVIIAVYCLSQFHLFLKYWTTKKENPPQFDESKTYPFVTVQLPIYNEKYVVKRLIDNILKLEYPKNRIEFQVLDDSTDNTKELSKKLVESYKSQGYQIAFIHRKDRSGYKAGALKNGMLTAKGELIAIFDADFLPYPDFLMCTLPYFNDPKTGVVQVRWDHLNQKENILTELQSLQLNVHFTVEQGGRYKGNYFLQFNGTAGIWRKETITDAGGWEADTLTEDLDLSYRAQLKGWKIKFLDDLVSPSELPMEISGLKSQQYRWMKGGAETAKKLLPTIWSGPISIVKKIQASIHLLSSSVYLIIFLLGFTSVPLIVLMKYVEIDVSFFAYFITSLPLIFIIYYSANVIIAWPKDSLIKRVFKFVFLFPVFLALSMGLSFHNSIAVIQGWLGKKSPFVRTPKKGLDGKIDTYKTKMVSIPTFLEGLLFCYYLSGIVIGLYLENITFLALHVMLSLGYGAVFFLSIQSLKK
jgi:cellulose synthase/poly-beta-1,6-N-acetylglucosamine synthase-like glycosyltransferase